MARYPYVNQGRFYQAAGEEPFALDAPAWLSWLGEHSAFTYHNHDFRYSVRREARPGGVIRFTASRYPCMKRRGQGLIGNTNIYHKDAH